MYEPASSGIYYYHTDPAGTPLAVTNTSGAVVWKGYYEPFGNEYAIQGTIGNDVRFAGNKKDDETGLNYFGDRYMDSSLARFHAPDPIGPVDSKTGKINDKILTEPQRLNAYAYGLNSPGRYVDRNGRDIYLMTGNNATIPFTNIKNPLQDALHQSIVVDTPKEPRGFSFGMSGFGLTLSSTWLGQDSPTAAILKGEIYETGYTGGRIDAVVHTTPEQDAAFVKYLLSRVGEEGGYSIARHNCREFSQSMFYTAQSWYGNSQ